MEKKIYEVTLKWTVRAVSVTDAVQTLKILLQNHFKSPEAWGACPDLFEAMVKTVHETFAAFPEK